MATVTQTGQKKHKGNPKLGEIARDRATKAAAMTALLAAHGCETVEELNAKLAAMGAAKPEAKEPEGFRVVGRKVYTGGKDPLAFIDKDCPWVSFVTSTSMFVLRPQRRNVQPPITRITIKSKGAKPWVACPFYIGDRTNFINDANLKVFKERWHHHQLVKQVADAIWADPRWPRPTTAVIDPEKYGGWDRMAKQAKGEHVEIVDFVPLREITRRLLQKSTDTFLNWIEMPKGYKFDRRIPNPYRNKITDVTVEFQTTRKFEE